MSTVIDALVVTLGLDPKNFQRGQKQARDDLNKTRQDADRTAKELEQRGKQAAEFYTKIRNEALTLFAVLAVGGGLKSFITGTIHSAAMLGRMSENLGMSTRQLDAWQKAAERAGGSAEGITAQLRESQKEVAQYRMGLPSDTVNWFLRLGGSPADLKDGNSYLLARAKILHALFVKDPARAGLAAQQMGISEDTFNLLKQGPAAVLALVAAQEKNAVITERQAKQAQALENKWKDIRDEFRATSIEVLFTLMPVINDLTAAIERGADWVVAHRQAIKEWVEKSVTKVREFADTADHAAQSVGGWKTILETLIALKLVAFTADLLGLTGALTNVGGALGLLGGAKAVAGVGVLSYLGGTAIYNHLSDKTKDFIGEHMAQVAEAFGSKDAHNALEVKRRGKRADYLMQQLGYAGYTPQQAAGIVGSLMQESKLDPTAVNPKSGAAGIGQWLGDRAKRFQKMFGTTPAMADFDDQVKFLIWELNNTHKKAGDAIHHAGSVADAAVLHRKLYEMPGEKEANDLARVAFGNEVYQWYKPIEHHDTPLKAAKAAPRIERKPASTVVKPKPKAVASLAFVPGANLAADEANVERQRRADSLDTIYAAMDRTNARDILRSARPPVNTTHNDNSTTTTQTSSSETHIGKIEVYTQAADAAGIARDIAPAIKQNPIMSQANGGLF